MLFIDVSLLTVCATASDHQSWIQLTNKTPPTLMANTAQAYPCRRSYDGREWPCGSCRWSVVQDVLVSQRSITLSGRLARSS